MAINFKCDQCGNRFRVADTLAGKSAKCPCGARLSIPLATAVASKPSREAQPPAPSAGVASLFEQELPTREEVNRGDRDEQLARWTAERLSPFHVPNQKLAASLLRPGSPRLVQLLAATIVGAGLGFSSAAKLREPSTVMTVSAIIGGTIIGAAVGVLLLVSDAIRARKRAGHRVPWLLDLYIGRGWLSIVAWIVTSFAGALLFVASLAME